MLGMEELKAMANALRYDTLKAIHIVGSGHPGGCLSMAEILSVLYFYKMNLNPRNPQWADRDRFILSKGHAAPILFTALVYRGYDIDIQELRHLRQHDGRLQATPNLTIPGCDNVSGSLGQNLSVAIGCALAGKMNGQTYKTYCVMGDGEMEEGQIWEAMMFAPKARLGNLVAVLDHNHVQATGDVAQIGGFCDAESKAKAFGWNVIKVPGHDVEALAAAFDSIPDAADGIPTFVIADTVKGKGVSFMEGKASWHVGCITDDQWEQIERELEGGKL